MTHGGEGGLEELRALRQVLVLIEEKRELSRQLELSGIKFHKGRPSIALRDR